MEAHMTWASVFLKLTWKKAYVTKRIVSYYLFKFLKCYRTFINLRFKV